MMQQRMLKQDNLASDPGALQILEPQPVLPAQFFQRRSQTTPEQRLMAAVLTEALDTITRYRGVDAPLAVKLYRDAWDWTQDDDTQWPYSFVNICHALGLDVSATRRALNAPLPVLRTRGHRRVRQTSGCRTTVRVGGLGHHRKQW